jgi:hypothetical protein
MQLLGDVISNCYIHFWALDESLSISVICGATSHPVIHLIFVIASAEINQLDIDLIASAR